MIPEAMARSRELTPGAKLIYGRLCRYAGADGLCYPAVATLAQEVALGERQVQKHLNTLEAKGFLRRDKHFDRNGGQTTNYYTFLWHQIFEEFENAQNAIQEVNSSSLSPVNGHSPKEGHFKEDDAQSSEMASGGPMSWASPKEGQREPVPFGRLDFYKTC